YRPKIDLTELAKLPSDTFGKHYATWMTSKKLRPFVISENLSEIADRNTFAVRYAVTHDMLHVLTGFDTSYAGEIGVLSFAVAQNYSPKLEASLKLASVLYPILSLGRFNAIANAKRRGTRFGKEADCLIGLRLEDHFGENLDALRASLGLCLNQNDTSPKKFGARRIRPSK
ncbi:MAG: Coq4 family protein, partial [Marinomonas sp.]